MKTKEELVQYHKEWRLAHKDKWNEYGKKWYAGNKAKRKQSLSRWEKRNPEARKAIQKRYRELHKEERAQEQRVRLLKWKTLVVAAYGGGCKCCGENEITFLTVEHLKKNGKIHRKVGGNFYYYLVRNNFPQEDLCILCMNCNWAERNGWPCPHKKVVATL